MPGPPSSPEAAVIAAFLALLRADTTFNAAFNPIILVDSPTLEAFMAYADGTAAVQPASLKGKDWPSKRQTQLIGILVSLYVPTEETSEDSQLLSVNWAGYIRKIAWGLALNDINTPSLQITFATTAVVPLTPLIPKEGTRILSYRVIFETDIDPTQNAFV